MASGPKDPKIFSILSLGAALLAATVARRGISSAWRAATGKNPPANPADPDVNVREALLWAAVSGTLIAIARMLASRRAANYYMRSTGQVPPSLQPGSDLAPPS